MRGFSVATRPASRGRSRGEKKGNTGFLSCVIQCRVSHSAGDILRLLQHARFTSTRGVLNQHWYGRRRATDHALCLHSGLFAFQVCVSHEHLSPRVTKRS